MHLSVHITIIEIESARFDIQYGKKYFNFNLASYDMTVNKSMLFVSTRTSLSITKRKLCLREFNVMSVPVKRIRDLFGGEFIDKNNNFAVIKIADKIELYESSRKSTKKRCIAHSWFYFGKSLAYDLKCLYSFPFCEISYWDFSIFSWIEFEIWIVYVKSFTVFKTNKNWLVRLHLAKLRIICIVAGFRFKRVIRSIFHGLRFSMSPKSSSIPVYLVNIVLMNTLVYLKYVPASVSK